MSSGLSMPACYRINDNWILDTARNQLQHGDSCIELEYRLVLLLCYFFKHPQQILSKTQLLQDNWPGRVINDENLTVAVSKLRKAFADNSKAPTLIKTIPGIGYQFIGRVEQLTVNCDTPQLVSTSTYTRQWFASLLAISLLTSSGVYWWHAPVLVQPDNSPATQYIEQQSRDKMQQIADLRAQLLLEPDNAEHYWQIAWLKMVILGTDLPEATTHFSELSALLEKTLSLNNQHAEAAMWLGRLYFWHKQHYAQAEQYMLQAIESNEHADMYYAYAEMLLATGRFDECYVTITQARKLEPATFSIPSLAWFYQLQGKTELAWQELQRISATELQTAQWHQSAQRVTFELGLHQQSYIHLRWLLRQSTEGQALLLQTDKLFAEDGLPRVYHYLLQQRFTADVGHYTPPVSWARYALLAGDVNAARLYFEQAALQKQWPLLWAGVETLYQPLHNTAAYQQWLTSIDLNHLLQITDN